MIYKNNIKFANAFLTASVFGGSSGLNEDVSNTLFSHFHLDYQDALSYAVIQVDRERSDLNTFGVCNYTFKASVCKFMHVLMKLCFKRNWPSEMLSVL